MKQGPVLLCVICRREGFLAAQFERHEVFPDFWYWVCLDDVWLLEDGK